MSKLKKMKKFMGAVAVITVLFALLVTVINQPTPALSQTVQVVSGSTPPGNTAWYQHSNQPDAVFGGQGIFVDVNTSSAGFTTTPIYITSIGGTSHHWAITGATSIYNPTPTGFRVYVRFPNGDSLTPAIANQYGWHINWIAVPQ
jgi:hypothetical protein